MRTSTTLFAGLVFAAAMGCRVSRDSATAAEITAGTDVTGTYFAADSGHNLGKDWCYSAALVLDSTRHFGSVIRMCSDDGSGPVTESIKGTYALRRSMVKVDNGSGRVPKLSVVLTPEGERHKKHTLVYQDGALRFDEPWWMGAGLRALEIKDPTLRRVSSVASTDSIASSTPALAPASGGATSPARKAAAK